MSENKGQNNDVWESSKRLGLDKQRLQSSRRFQAKQNTVWFLKHLVVVELQT